LNRVTLSGGAIIFVDEDGQGKIENMSSSEEESEVVNCAAETLVSLLELPYYDLDQAKALLIARWLAARMGC
jgi:hypothetical protein